MFSKKHIPLIVLGILILAALACATPNPLTGTPDEGGQLADFWVGLWHGLIAPIAFVVSLFDKSVAVYDVHNVGGWYDFGFLLGVGAFASGGTSASSRRS